MATLPAVFLAFGYPPRETQPVEPATLKLTAATVCMAYWYVSKLWVSPVSKDASYLCVLIHSLNMSS